MAQRKKVTAPVNEVEREEEARAALARESAFKLASLKPAPLRASLAAKLEREGFEVTKAFVRRPLRAQLKEALEHGALVPVKSLAAHVRGATAGELRRLIEEVVREGSARRVLRGSAEVLAGAEVRVLSAAEVEAMRVRVVGLGKALEKATKKQGLSLLASDVTTALAEAMTAFQERTGAAAVKQRNPSEGVMLSLLEAVDFTRDVRSGLSFVPAVVGRLAPRLDAAAVVKLLLTAAERELLELRPEGGIGRLSEAELSVCPLGPHGTRLSWARRLAGGAA